MKGSRTSEGRVCSATSRPSETSECVACRMYQITAAAFMPLPIMEMRLAANSSLIPRCWNASRMGHCNPDRAERVTYTERANIAIRPAELRLKRRQRKELLGSQTSLRKKEKQEHRMMREAKERAGSPRPGVSPAYS